MVKFVIPIPIFMPAVFVRIGAAILLFYRKKRYGYPFRKIKLTQNKFAIVDQEDYEKLNANKWYAKRCGRNFYAHRKNGAGATMSMHRQIMKPPRGYCVDHKNGDGLNNTRNNLRIVTTAENNYNKRKSLNVRSSKYKGVSIDKRTNKWRAIIYYKYIKIHLGCFDSEEEAARAYDEAARELYGEYAMLNFTTENTEKQENKF
ncbi:MAG: AP2/ERF family transcription factor [Sedimentisphaerales bacterium]